MKIWVNAIDFKHAQDLVKNKDVDFVVVGMQDQLSTRLSCCLGIKDIKKIVCDKLVVSLNNIFVDDQLALLEATLKQLKSIGVKTIIFTDFAVKQICNEINYHPYFVYNSETLTTNYSQLPFLLEKGINEVVLPRELFWNEIKEFANNKGKMSIQIQAEGYGLMMHSKWNLLTNFKDQFGIDKNLTNKKLYLKEQTRQLPNVIIEDNTGTHMFTEYNVSVLEYFDQMIDLGIDSINIFSFLHDRKWVDETLAIYCEAIKAAKQGTFTKHKENLLKRIAVINKVSTCGFLEPTVGLLHLEREVNNE